MNRERTAELEESYLAEHLPGTVEPFVFDEQSIEELKQGGTFPFPVITDALLSDEWEETDELWFVDSSGFGSPDEPALTAGAFRKRIIKYVREHPDHGFGLSGVGQFQVYVSAYRRI